MTAPTLAIGSAGSDSILSRILSSSPLPIVELEESSFVGLGDGVGMLGLPVIELISSLLVSLAIGLLISSLGIVPLVIVLLSTFVLLGLLELPPMLLSPLGTLVLFVVTLVSLVGRSQEKLLGSTKFRATYNTVYKIISTQYAILFLS